MSYRHVYTNNTVPGMFISRNAGNRTPGTSISIGVSRRIQFLDRILSARVTGQATPRNKINLSWQEELVYNLTNTDVVTGFNQTFTATSWLTPTEIQPARYAKISAQFDY